MNYAYVDCLLCNTTFPAASRRLLNVEVSSGKPVRLCTRCVSRLYLLRIIEKHQFSASLDPETLKRIVEV